MDDFNGLASVENYCFNHPEWSTKKTASVFTNGFKEI